ncbi:hypothetical protein FB45DRAFT_832714, partial [Roridomyces roridus]
MQSFLRHGALRSNPSRAWSATKPRHTGSALRLAARAYTSKPAENHSSLPIINAAHNEDGSAVVSEKFNFPHADVTFRSSDNVLFHLHRKNLDICASGFPGEMASTGEVLELPEASATLELLFQFLYPQPQPALDTAPLEVLKPLAEAAEKYKVFPAMSNCRGRFWSMAHEHPLDVAAYAAKHDYAALFDKVAPIIVSMPSYQVMQILPPYLILPWARYRDEWQAALEDSVHDDVVCAGRVEHSHTENTTHGPDDQYRDAAFWILIDLGRGIGSLRNLNTIFHTGDEVWQQCCLRDLERWRKCVEERIAKIP